MKNRTRLTALAAGLATLSFVAGAVPAQAQAPSLTLHFIDVGQGDSTLITCPNGANILIDAGNLPRRAQTETRVRDYVRNQIASRGGDIDYLILSHPDADHYNLLRPVLQGVPIGRTYYVATRNHYSDRTLFDWISTVGRTNVHLTGTDFDRQTAPNPDIDCGAAHVWIVAAGVQVPNDDKNTKSIVVMVRMGDFEAMITGDATFATEDVIMGRYAPTWLDIDVLQVGHHGSERTSTSPRWAATLSPRTAIMSAGSQNDYGHPRRAVTDLLEPQTDAADPHPYRDVTIRAQSPKYRYVTRPTYRESIYSTSTNGTIVVRTTGTGYSVLTNQ